MMRKKKKDFDCGELQLALVLHLHLLAARLSLQFVIGAGAKNDEEKRKKVVRPLTQSLLSSKGRERDRQTDAATGKRVIFSSQALFGRTTAILCAISVRVRLVQSQEEVVHLTPFRASNGIRHGPSCSTQPASRTMQSLLANSTSLFTLSEWQRL